MSSSDKNVRLKITEIFYSLQGEAYNTGLPTVFIRLTGCPLRCHYCDTEYAFTGGQWMSLDEIIEEAGRYQTPRITVTGGEPLAQKNCISLLGRLCDEGYEVSLETSGALPLEAVDSRVIKVVDIKTPASGESDKNRLQNLACLNPEDQLKFVICNRHDYDWSRDFIMQHQLEGRCEILFSPVQDTLAADELAEWILQDHLNVRFQIQLHKYLWGDKTGV
ncbi:MAG TPA: 7-carboxy-7-deazaguanine synthase QueE [Gammaproteobacteria bacterium]|nr:7-carboxy-7-deazaguanine synthase QueE [Gammaproteobacteria bacterium]